jgi:hypothetical protein
MKKRKPKETVPPATRALLAELLGHYHSAVLLGCCPQRFAVRSENLSDIGVPEETVTGLVERGYLERVPSGGLVLTAAGAVWAAQWVDDKDVAAEGGKRGTKDSDLPRWDGRRLYSRGEVVLEQVRVAPNQGRLLNAFEKVKWDEQIDVSPRDGVDGLKEEQLRQTYSSLNKRLKAASLVFERTADGKGLRWVWRR